MPWIREQKELSEGELCLLKNGRRRIRKAGEEASRRHQERATAQLKQGSAGQNTGTPDIQEVPKRLMS